MEPAQFDPMGSHDSRSGFFELAQLCSDPHFIGGLSNLPNNDGYWKTNERQMGSKNNLDDRSKRLHLSLRVAFAY